MWCSNCKWKWDSGPRRALQVWKSCLWALHRVLGIRRTQKVSLWAAGFLLHIMVNYTTSSCAPWDSDPRSSGSLPNLLFLVLLLNPWSSKFILRKCSAASGRVCRKWMWSLMTPGLHFSYELCGPISRLRPNSIWVDVCPQSSSLLLKISSSFFPILRSSIQVPRSGGWHRSIVQQITFG